MNGSGRVAAGVRFPARGLAALCLLSAFGGAAQAAQGDARGFLAASHADGTRTLRAWIQVDARRTLFYAVSLDRRGAVTGVCSEPSPIPAVALTTPSGDIDTITTWTWQWLNAKGYGRPLVGFWHTPDGMALAAASTRGTPPPGC